jgi:hypothetical protein
LHFEKLKLRFGIVASGGMFNDRRTESKALELQDEERVGWLGPEPLVFQLDGSFLLVILIALIQPAKGGKFAADITLRYVICHVHDHMSAVGASVSEVSAEDAEGSQTVLKLVNPRYSHRGVQRMFAMFGDKGVENGAEERLSKEAVAERWSDVICSGQKGAGDGEEKDARLTLWAPDSLMVGSRRQ